MLPKIIWKRVFPSQIGKKPNEKFVEQFNSVRLP